MGGETTSYAFCVYHAAYILFHASQHSPGIASLVLHFASMHLCDDIHWFTAMQINAKTAEYYYRTCATQSNVSNITAIDRTLMGMI